MPSICFFQGCLAPTTSPDSWRCEFHRGRRRCAVDTCLNQAYARSLCTRHGGKRQCEFPNCTYRVRCGNLCSQHGSRRTKTSCSEPGCTNSAQLHRRCVKHGGGRLCKVPSCPTFARKGGLCARHKRLEHDTTAPGSAAPYASFDATLAWDDADALMFWFPCISHEASLPSGKDAVEDDILELLLI